ncbi:MAG: c-type cytochrome biogenesis protein CcsB [Ornithinimicrobium sp.]
MRNDTLAAASDIGVWATMAVLAVAMIAFAAHLAVQTASAKNPAARASSVRVGGSGQEFTVEDQLDAGATTTDPGGDDHHGRQPVGGSRRWGVLGLQLTLVATVLLVAATAMRGLSVQRAPLGNMYEFALAACCFALLIYSGWSLRRDRLWLGLFVAAPVLLILGFARGAWYTEASALVPSLNSIWLVIHVTVATLTVGLFVIGFAVAVLYLIQDRAEKRAGLSGPDQRRAWTSALPRAESLERLTYGIHVVAFPLWTFTLIAGAIWAEQSWGRYWGWDPKEVWTFVIFVVYAAYLHARATTGWTTRKATWLAIVGFACVVVNYVIVNVYIPGLHSYSGL